MLKNLLKLRNKLKDNKGFTLIEMLIVIFIIAILLVLIVPNISKNLDSAKDKSSEAYVKTVQSQITAYELNEGDSNVTFDKLVSRGYLEGDVEKASTAPNGKKVVILGGKAQLQG
ncbi:MULTISPECIES: competence type IV pilus major pilin ComGC [unclassified Gemella]|uniref:competence type IV pilus major pilin ComGC n=1 Tax=unclassified Gemella TaxID=2624949 RepID=UPI001073E2EF|nr:MULTISPECIES: competence type IV pilus major pilin ComGC [unclassified Gemella]MBF0709771.1 prepilin-type N-terminal cleavage/methylation domain-containing protein [Gemella sp. GL1.1]MBF0747141.1 prepilin-type N-terminal cleavage/methylation domain-containing protein [Gemella sp. 19428wG2_WT2a]NYS27115.1 prepilin-type N-terminal cleavage/methylation domain-containing protein [Gemella sp. GL1]TFU58381.1 prepilin-type N-terminal cleavage/methylation domain-containing protein [Gemella sp. WT2a]